MEQNRSQVPHVGGKPLKSLKDVLKEEYINQGSPEEFEGQHGPESNDKDLLDKEKAAYLFDAEEMSTINKDLNEIDEELRGIRTSFEGQYSEEYLKFISDNQPKLESALKDGYDTTELHEPSITIKKEEGGHLNIAVVEDPGNRLKEKTLNEVQAVSAALANQKGLAKIWAINERFGIDPNADLTEEKAFGVELKKGPDEYYDNLRRFKGDSKYSFPVPCPLCKGKKHFKILFFEIKCPKCAGTGAIKVDSKEYYKVINKEVQSKGIKDINTVRDLIFEGHQKIVKF